MSPVVSHCRLAAVLALSILLAACSGSLLESKKIDYKTASANRVPTLEVPPDLTSPTRDDRYAVPDTGGGKGSATYSAYAAERSPESRAQQKSDVLPEVDNSRIERAGNERWLVVKGTPEKLWGQVKDFWQETGPTSSSAIAGCTRYSFPRARIRHAGNRARPIRSSRRRCCAA